MNRYGAAASLAAALAVAVAVCTPFSSEASSNYEMRKRVVSLSGIVTGASSSEYVTRAEFARMLVNATTYKSTASRAGMTAVFCDVPADSQYAQAVRLASENGWMTGYLGGVFRPDQQITMQEAARGVLALLGYTDQDFMGDPISSRWTKFNYLDLGENIDKEPQEVMTRVDCVNLFYNLLRTDTADGKAYCTVLGYALSSDGEVNALTIADNDLKGPRLVGKSDRLDNYLPFDANEASYYLDGEFATIDSVKQAKTADGVVIYYNTASKTVWAYDVEDQEAADSSGMVAVKGEITGIFYNSSDVMTPSTVILENIDYNEYKLGSTDVQFAFSIYGQFEVGDEVILICEVTSNVNGDISYNVIDYVAY